MKKYDAFQEKALRPMGIKELAVYYEVSEEVVRAWLKPLTDKIGIRVGHKYNMVQIYTIVGHLGIMPSEPDTSG